MKQPNTRAELLRHAADLDEKDEPLAGRFEYKNFDGRWHLLEDKCPDFYRDRVWRIVDQDQHLLGNGWIRHTGDVCPVNEGDIVHFFTAYGEGANTYAARHLDWQKQGGITHYKVIKAHVEPTTFVLDGVTLNRPYMSAPAIGAGYCAIDSGGLVQLLNWTKNSIHHEYMANFNAWRTAPDALAYQAVRKAQMAKALESKQ